MSDALLAKLNFKDQERVLVLQAPPEFQPVLTHWAKRAQVDTSAGSKKSYPFTMAFVQSEAEVKKFGLAAVKQLEGDGVCWMVYPKKTSKKYQAGITRDTGWALLGELGFEGVRQVAIDEDWSALRFRRAEHIGSMIRRQSMALSQAGKAKTVNKTNKAVRGSRQ
jgi:hypothetical protein